MNPIAWLLDGRWRCRVRLHSWRSTPYPWIRKCDRCKELGYCAKPPSDLNHLRVGSTRIPDDILYEWERRERLFGRREWRN